MSPVSRSGFVPAPATEHAGGYYYGQFVWFEDDEFHVAVWRRKQWRETVSGKVLIDLLNETTRRLALVRR